MASEPARTGATLNRMKSAALGFLLLAGCLLVASMTVFGTVKADILGRSDSPLYQIR